MTTKLSITSEPAIKKFININDEYHSSIKKTALSKEIRKAINIDENSSNKLYQKQNFAISTHHFEACEQREINQLKYSPPVTKIMLPYKYHGEYLILDPSNIIKNTASVYNDSLINKKQENSQMLTNGINASEIKTYNNFRLNRSASKFSNFILEIKSFKEKGIRDFKHFLNKDKNEEHCIVFKNNKVNITDGATIARQELAKQHEKINQTKKVNNLISPLQQEKIDLYNNYKILLNEINQIESNTNKLIIENQKIKGPYQYHNQFNSLNIIDIIDSTKPSTEKYKQLNTIFNQMKSTIRMLENEYKSFKFVTEQKNKELMAIENSSTDLEWDYYSDTPEYFNTINENHHSSNKDLSYEFNSSTEDLYSSNDSLNLSDYASEITSDSGYSSEGTTKQKTTILEKNDPENKNNYKNKYKKTNIKKQSQ